MEHWVKNWQKDRVPKVVTNGVPLCLFLGPDLFIYLSTIQMQDLDAPLASLLRIPKWEMWFAFLRDKRLYRGYRG